MNTYKVRFGVAPGHWTAASEICVYVNAENGDDAIERALASTSLQKDGVLTYLSIDRYVEPENNPWDDVDGYDVQPNYTDREESMIRGTKFGLLGNGDIIEAGDEWWSPHDDAWHPVDTDLNGMNVPTTESAIGDEWNADDYKPMRRPL